MPKLYSKYSDAKGRKFIVIERFATVDFENKTEVPSSIKLLDVNSEFTNMITYAELNEYIATKRLTQVQTF